MNNQQGLKLFLSELKYSYDNVLFYKKHLDKAGVTLGDICTLADVSRIPPTQKRDYRKHFPMGVMAKGYSLDSVELTRSQSSGTTGERLITYELGMLLMGRAMACCEPNADVEDAFVKSKRKICRYAAPNCSDVECANPNSGMEDRLLSDGTLVLPVYHDLLTTSDTLIERAIEEIMSYKPDFYYVDPTHFAFLMGEFKKRGLRPPKAPIIASYTSVTELNKKRILERFDDDVVFAELLSCSEMGWVAMACPHNRLHLNDQSFFIEVIGTDGEQVAPGSSGELYISSIDNGAIPHLRYKTGDILKVDEQSCTCGHPSRTVQMLGRQANSVKLADGSFMPLAPIQKSIGAPKGWEMYQLHQHDVTNYTLRVIADDSSCDVASKSAVVNALKTLLGKQVEIRIQQVSYIATERSGKFQCLKSDISE